MPIKDLMASECYDPMFDRFRFFRLVSTFHKNSVCKLTAHRTSKVAYLINKGFGHIKEPSADGVIFNLSSFRPSELESFILAHGLDFCVPLHMPDREKVFADIEVLYSQLAKLKPSSDLASSDFKAKLNSLAHTFSGMSVAFDESRWRNEHRRVIKSLRNDNNLIISKPDKGAGVVLLDHDDYVNKMSLILNDSTKLIELGPVETCVHTTSIEVKFQKQQKKWVKSGLLSLEISDSIRPVGSIRPCRYGLPKIHKDGVLLRPILSMVGSAQQKVASWLSSVLRPVLENFCRFCIKDSFSFSKIVRNFIPTDVFMCSFDVCSLYTTLCHPKIGYVNAMLLFRSRHLAIKSPLSHFIGDQLTPLHQTHKNHGDSKVHFPPTATWLSLNYSEHNPSHVRRHTLPSQPSHLYHISISSPYRLSGLTTFPRILQHKKQTQYSMLQIKTNS